MNHFKTPTKNWEILVINAQRSLPKHIPSIRFYRVRLISSFPRTFPGPGSPYLHGTMYFQLAQAHPQPSLSSPIELYLAIPSFAKLPDWSCWEHPTYAFETLPFSHYFLLLLMFYSCSWKQQTEPVQVYDNLANIQFWSCNNSTGHKEWAWLSLYSYCVFFYCFKKGISKVYQIFQ